MNPGGSEQLTRLQICNRTCSCRWSWWCNQRHLSVASFSKPRGRIRTNPAVFSPEIGNLSKFFGNYFNLCLSEMSWNESLPSFSQKSQQTEGPHHQRNLILHVPVVPPERSYEKFHRCDRLPQNRSSVARFRDRLRFLVPKTRWKKLHPNPGAPSMPSMSATGVMWRLTPCGVFNHPQNWPPKTAAFHEVAYEISSFSLEIRWCWPDQKNQRMGQHTTT